MSSRKPHAARTGRLAALLVFVLACAGASSGPAVAQDGARRVFEVSARKHAFTPARIEVQQDDLVKITFRAEDIPHSFTIDEYRIAKRAGAGQSVTFEFRADEPGEFPFYCNLMVDEGCRQMRGLLVVRPR